MKHRRLALISRFAFYPMHWEAFRFLCRHYDVRGAVIAAAPPELPSVHKQLGWIEVEEARGEDFAPDIRLMPSLRGSEQRAWVQRQCTEVRPDAIWFQGEPIDTLLFDVLATYRHRPGPTIVTAVCENIFRRPWLWERQRRQRLWQRLDGILATAQASIEGLRAAGMPAEVPSWTLVAGGQEAPPEIEPLPLPIERNAGDLVVGFAGRIVAEKGWKVLWAAMESLPSNVKAVFVGDGAELDELRRNIAAQAPGRCASLGILPKTALWRFYKAVDCLVLPSLTTRHWKEQFGGVLADAMALGLPIVGSDSGSIPEVVGPAGLIVPEGDAARLASALARLQQEPDFRRTLGQAGRRRFDEHFSIAAYSAKIARALGLSAGVHPAQRRHSQVG